MNSERDPRKRSHDEIDDGASAPVQWLKIPRRTSEQTTPQSVMASMPTPQQTLPLVVVPSQIVLNSSDFLTLMTMAMKGGVASDPIAAEFQELAQQVVTISRKHRDRLDGALKEVAQFSDPSAKIISEHLCAYLLEVLPIIRTPLTKVYPRKVTSKDIGILYRPFRTSLDYYTSLSSDLNIFFDTRSIANPKKTGGYNEFIDRVEAALKVPNVVTCVIQMDFIMKRSKSSRLPSEDELSLENV